jgi:ABC-type lipoprotein export system ATPase subunit
MENFYTKKEVKKYCIQGENPNYDLHNFDVPFRALVIAPSGSGKSIFLTNLITLFCKGTEGTFDNIYIFCKSRDEPLYKYLSDKSKELIDAIKI